MTINGWLQIAIYCVLIFLFVKPFGAYMANVFDGRRTPLSLVLRPVEKGLYALFGVKAREEPELVRLRHFHADVQRRQLPRALPAPALPGPAAL